MPAENLLYPFAPTDTGSNLLTDPDYLADAQRITGNQPGIARAQLVNKALRSSSLVASAWGKVVADHHDMVVNDSIAADALAALLLQVITDIASGSTPVNGYETVGMVAAFPTTAPPSGWLRANGAYLSRATYAPLFARIGTTFGFTDSSNFRLPDLRGMFLRGWDDGRGWDAGRTMGSVQDATHVCGDDGTSIGTHAPANMNQVLGDPSDNNARLMAYVPSRYTETTTDGPSVYWRRVRPVNVALLFCIKF